MSKFIQITLISMYDTAGALTDNPRECQSAIPHETYHVPTDAILTYEWIEQGEYSSSKMHPSDIAGYSCILSFNRPMPFPDHVACLVRRPGPDGEPR